MSGTHQNPNNPSHSPPTRQRAEQRTYSTVENAATSSENTLVQYPPTIPPEEYVPEIIDYHGLKATYLVPTDAVGQLVKKRCKSRGLSARVVRSDKSLCEMYSGEHGEAEANRLKQILYHQPVSLAELHSNGELPCQSGSGCPFARNNSTYDEDVLIGHPVIAHAEAFREGRTIFTQYVKCDEYRTEIKNPEKELTPYIDSLDIDCDSYTELIKQINTGDIEIGLYSYTYHGRNSSPMRANILDITNTLKNKGNVLAPLAIFGLRYSETLDNGICTTHSFKKGTHKKRVSTTRYENPRADRWSNAGLEYDRHRVVRITNEEESDTIHILHCPDFSESNGVVALDTVPVKRMWDTSYGVNFDFERVLSEQQTREFLRDTMDTTVVHVSDKPRPYDSGRVRSGRDTSIAQWIDAEYGNKPILVTTRNALEDEYRPARPFPAEDTDRTMRYRLYEPPVTDPSPVIFASGAPRPPNKEFQVWGAFQGHCIPGEPDSNNSFGEVGDQIRYQLRDAYVGRSVTRLTKKGATIVLNTTACPEWLQSPRDTKANPTNVLSNNATGKRRVLRYLRYRGDDPPSKQGIMATTGADVSDDTAQDAIELFTSQEWVVTHSGPDKTYYEWNP